jgi:hypothetical protein
MAAGPTGMVDGGRSDRHGGLPVDRHGGSGGGLGVAAGTAKRWVGGWVCRDGNGGGGGGDKGSGMADKLRISLLSCCLPCCCLAAVSLRVTAAMAPSPFGGMAAGMSDKWRMGWSYQAQRSFQSAHMKK